MLRSFGLIFPIVFLAFTAASFAGAGKEPGDAQAASKPATREPAVPKPAKGPTTYTGPKVVLKAGPKPGSYLWTAQFQSTQTILPQGQPQTRATRNWQSLTTSGDLVADPADAAGRRKFSVVCARVEQTVKVADKVRQYDSAGPAAKQDEVLRQAWGALAGWKGARVVGPDGQTQKIEGVEALLARVEPGPRLAEMRQELRTFAEAMLQDLGAGWWERLLPSGPVGPGDQWRATVYLPAEPALGAVRFDCNCLLQDIFTSQGQKLAVIDFTAAAFLDAHLVDSSLLLLLPVKVQVRDMALSLSGRMQFDLAAALASDLRMNLAGKGEMLVADAKGISTRLKVAFESSRQKTVQATGP